MVWMAVGVLKITDRYFDKRSREALDRQGPLVSCAVAVTIFHAIMCIGLVRLQEFSKEHPRRMHSTDIEFALATPPPDPGYQLRIKPPPKIDEVPSPDLVETKVEAAGGSTASRQGQQEEKVSSKGNSMQEQVKQVIQQTATEHLIPSPVLVNAQNTIRAQTFSKEQDLQSLPKTGNQIAPLEENLAAGNHKSTGEEISSEEKGAVGVGEGDNATVGESSGAGITHRIDEAQTRQAVGNITPYKKAVLVKIAEIWKPTRNAHAIVQIEIGKEGQILGQEFFYCSTKKCKKHLEEVFQQVELPPLPDWYKGESLSFRLELDMP